MLGFADRILDLGGLELSVLWHGYGRFMASIHQHSQRWLHHGMYWNSSPVWPFDLSCNNLSKLTTIDRGNFFLQRKSSFRC